MKLTENIDEPVAYTLQAVVTHSGQPNSGHYVALIKPSGDEWHRFDDLQVQKCDKSAAITENYGDGTNNRNAYMLVYRRNDDFTVKTVSVDSNISSGVINRKSGRSNDFAVGMWLSPTENVYADFKNNCSGCCADRVVSHRKFPIGTVRA